MSPVLSRYAQQLQDPRWQRKRLEVLARQDFTCEECEATETTLHVHHMYYERGLAPWEYPDGALRCLCKDCHETVAATQLELARALQWMRVEELDEIIGYAIGMALWHERGVGRVESSGQVAGLSRFAGLSEVELWTYLGRDGTMSPLLRNRIIEIHRIRPFVEVA